MFSWKTLLCHESSVTEAEFKPTVWGSWGRRCSAEAHEGIRQTPSCLLSAQSPGSRSPETYTLQAHTNTFCWQVSSRETRFRPSTWCLGSRTCHCVVHVKAITFDVFQSQTPVDEHPVTKHNNTAEVQSHGASWLSARPPSLTWALTTQVV